MARMKALIMGRKKYKITGTAMVEHWNREEGEVKITPFFLTSDKLTHNNIKKSVNDGGFSCRRIISAVVHIYDVYEQDYMHYNRKLVLDEQQCLEAHTTGVTF